MRKKALSLFESISIAHLLSFSLGIAERCLRVSRAVRAADRHLQSNTCAYSYRWGGFAYGPQHQKRTEHRRPLSYVSGANDLR